MSIERLRERVRELEIQHEIRQIRKRIRELELTGNEEHPPNGDIIYDYPPAYDEYEDEEWYSWYRCRELLMIPTHLIEKKYGDGPTVVTGGPVASMATLPFVPEVQRRKGDEAIKLGAGASLDNNDTVDLEVCLEKDVIEISSDRNEGSGDWDSPEYKDTAGSGEKKETEALVFHKMYTEEDSDRYIAQCFVNGLYASDG
ncbi:hypothetical protein Tco_1272556 [Tanacetum coccineum]